MQLPSQCRPGLQSSEVISTGAGGSAFETASLTWLLAGGLSCFSVGLLEHPYGVVAGFSQ